jgi:hypothetical protein
MPSSPTAIPSAEAADETETVPVSVEAHADVPHRCDDVNTINVTTT